MERADARTRGVRANRVPLRDMPRVCMCVCVGLVRERGSVAVVFCGNAFAQDKRFKTFCLAETPAFSALTLYRSPARSSRGTLFSLSHTAMMMSSTLQSYQGPSDPMLRSSAVEGYTQVSRVGEQVVNCFVDSYEFGVVPDTFSQAELEGGAYKDGDAFKKPTGAALASPGDDVLIAATQKVVEYKPHFYEWATATTGMLTVARKQRSTFRCADQNAHCSPRPSVLSRRSSPSDAPSLLSSAATMWPPRPPPPSSRAPPARAPSTSSTSSSPASCAATASAPWMTESVRSVPLPCTSEPPPRQPDATSHPHAPFSCAPQARPLMSTSH